MPDAIVQLAAHFNKNTAMKTQYFCEIIATKSREKKFAKLIFNH